MMAGTLPVSARRDPDVFGRRVDAAMRLAAGANLAYALSVVVLFVYVAQPQFTTFGWVWMALAIPFAGLSVAALWVGRRRSPVVRQWYLRVLAVAWTAQAAVNLILVIYLLPRVDSGRQMVLVATFAGTLGTGAIVMSTLRSMGILWVVVHVGIIAPAFWTMGEPAYVVLTLQLLVYGGVLMVAVVYLADSFKRRSLAEGTALQSQQVVELLLDDFEDGSRDWLWETGPGGVFTRAPDRLAEVSGHSPDELLQMSLTELLEGVADPSDQGAAALRTLSAALDHPHGIRDLIIPVRVGGAQRWWSLSAKPVMSKDGEVVGWRGVGSDTTDAHIHEREMQRLADTDPLTGLANRRKFQEYLQGRLTRWAPGEQYVLAIFDLDNFKSVNDTLGHGVGDQLLEQVASRLETSSEGDFVARLGGDEFAVVVHCSELGQFPEMLFAKYQSALAPPFTIRGNRVQITSSVGIAHTWAGTVGAEELVRMADLALYDAKAVATGRMSVFMPTMSIRAHSRAALLTDLDRAIDNDEFVFYYQPQHCVRTGHVVGMEALLRWQHPTRGLLPPSAFLDAAESSGLLVPLGAHMLRRACERLSTLGNNVRLAVNLSLVEIEDPDFLDRIEGLIIEFGIDAGRLELEVTESAAATTRSESVLREVRQMGVRIAVDDFGTGYSSLARLQSMPVDVLKVDRAFAASLRAHDPRTRQAALVVMHSVVEMARVLGVQTLAEGIERQKELTVVRDLGFDYVQGFFVGTPVPETKRHLALVDARSPEQESTERP
jgi:diguanylate cyclase (GGDEF)-like protein